MATTLKTATATAGKAPHLFLSHVALAQLEFGDKLKGVGANARKDSDPAAVKSLARSIAEVGLLVPLTVTRPARDSGPWYVIDGNTRLAALRSMHKPDAWDGVLVPTFEPADGADSVQALELSMIANSERTDLHPVDRFEVFAKMIAGGATVEAIGARYMLKPAQVRQALALAKMAPEIRQAWRDDKIDGDVAEAFAQTPDHAHQVRVLKKLGHNANNSWQVNREIMGSNESAGKLLKFVGRAAFEGAGHHVNDSLFADEDERNSQTVSNMPALKALADAKIAAECERLVTDGWGWAITKDKAPNDIYAWRRTPPNPGKDVKAKAGCTVGIGHSGELEVQRGYVKPGTTVTIPKSPAEKAKASTAAKAKAAAGGLTQSLSFELSRQITTAAYQALRGDGTLALRVAIAGMASTDGPARIRLSGMEELEGNQAEDNEFAKYFALTAGKGAGELLELLAEWTARSLSLVAHTAERLPFADKDEPGAALLLNALKVPAFKKAMLAAFDRKVYFAGVNRDQVRAALIDCGGLALAANASTMKKAGLVAFAIDKVTADWLPPELRTKHYDGPAAKPAKPAPKAKPAKKARAHK